jgi:hypothetical protein
LSLPKSEREYHEWTNGANFSKIIGEIRQIRAIRVKNACRKITRLWASQSRSH